jgi:hypothetical protein
MSFTITISEIPDKELGPIVAGLKLPRSVKYEQTHFIDVEIATAVDPTAKKKRGKIRKRKRMSHAELMEMGLSMSGRESKQHGSQVARGLMIFERLEGENGIGSVTVLGFRKALTKGKIKNADLLQKRMVRDEYLNYLE